MSNYIEYDDKIAFHPGYYIKEIVDESGLTQEDFAKRLDTTPKNLSLLIRGEQSLSIDIAMKLSRMIGTSVAYWLNLQNAYDALIAKFRSKEELDREREVFANLDYKYFRDNFGLPDLPRRIDEQIEQVRKLLNVATLTVLKKRDMAVSFRQATNELTEANTIKANTMVEIATNIALDTQAPRFNKTLFEEKVNYALTLSKDHDRFYPLIKAAFEQAGVIFVILPNIAGSKINGATKKVGCKIMLMVNDRRLYSDNFWFTLFHEIGHIMNGDYGISFDSEYGEQEKLANKYAEDMLVPREEYEGFVAQNKFSSNAIKSFATQIDREPGIVLGRLLTDGKVSYDSPVTKNLRRKYKIKTI
jgi:addiction module HigA family antidote